MEMLELIFSLITKFSTQYKKNIWITYLKDLEIKKQSLFQSFHHNICGLDVENKYTYFHMQL
jgi:hypothetical protein